VDGATKHAGSIHQRGIELDPVSQAALGASWAQSASRGAKLRDAGMLGAVSGMAPDLDTLIQSRTDPLLFLEFHRHFTHALAFVPVGALVCAAVFHWAVRRRLAFHQTYLYCVLGYGSHGLLDACTSYGTQLLWPFSDERIAWNVVSVVDPLFTLPVLALIVLAARARRARYAHAAVAWAVVYLAFGYVQLMRAQAEGLEHALRRGHEPARLEAKPSFGNMLLWKVIYEHDGRYYVDAVRTGVRRTVIDGESTEKLDLEKHFPWLDPESRQARDIERFRRVSDDFLAVDESAPQRVVDMRYSMVPNEIDGFWAIVVDPGAAADDHVQFITTRENAPEQTRRFLAMLFP
jgi:inner membrane protein